MTIEHKILTDEDGNPVAAQISWEQFQVIKAEMHYDDDAPLSPEWKAEIDRRFQSIKDGTAVGIPHDEVMRDVRARMAELRKGEPKSA